MIYEATLKAFARDGEMPQSRKHLPCKNENLSLFLRIHVKTNKHAKKKNKIKRTKRRHNCPHSELQLCGYGDQWVS